MPRTTVRIPLPRSSIGSGSELIFHNYGPVVSSETAYIQASLHADELPGLLVANHLVHLLDKADNDGQVLKKIVVVPFANPIGLSQSFLGSHVGRFSASSGTNFNRDWIDVTDAVAVRVDGHLHPTDPSENVRIIRSAIALEIDNLVLRKEDAAMKKELFKVASMADIVLDLHCDADAVMHMYTHDRLWPKFSDLALSIGSQCHILSPLSGGGCFDEACSCPWAALADRFPQFPIPMACESATIELRGEYNVYDDLAAKDALGLFRFLQGRGYIAQSVEEQRDQAFAFNTAIVIEPTPLTGVDMIEPDVPGVLAWRVKPGDVVTSGQLLGEIVNIVDPDAPRTPIVSRTDGIVFGMRSHKLSRPGDVVVKVAGHEALEWRIGNLLTSR